MWDWIVNNWVLALIGLIIAYVVWQYIASPYLQGVAQQEQLNGAQSQAPPPTLTTTQANAIAAAVYGDYSDTFGFITGDTTKLSSILSPIKNDGDMSLVRAGFGIKNWGVVPFLDLLGGSGTIDQFMYNMLTTSDFTNINSQLQNQGVNNVFIAD